MVIVGLVASGCRPVPGPLQSMPTRDEMAFIHGGSFRDARGYEHVIDDITMDRTEVTVQEYRACVRAGACAAAGTYLVRDWDARLLRYVLVKQRRFCNYSRPNRRNHPMNCITIADATQYCAWRGKRVATEWEWEWAARGRDEGRRFPWGDEPPTCERVVMSEPSEAAYACGRGYTTWRVGSKPSGASRDGVLDLAGNVSEIVLGAEPNTETTRGGSYIGLPWDFEVSRRDGDEPRKFSRTFPSGRAGPESGFRCVRTAERDRGGGSGCGSILPAEDTRTNCR